MSNKQEKLEAAMQEFARKIILTERISHCSQIIESMPELSDSLRTEAQAVFQKMVDSLEQ